MANLASTAVVVNYGWTEGDVTGKRYVSLNVTLTLTGQGSVTNQITAASLGLAGIEKCSNFYDATNNKVYPATPKSDKSCVLLIDLTQGTDANRATPADITATLTGVVTGYR